MSLAGYICAECHVYHQVVDELNPCPRQQTREFINLVGKDKLYDFVTTGWHPKLPAGIRVSSAKQWQRVIKQHGVTDDIGIQERIRRRERDTAGQAFTEARQRLRQRVGRTLRNALMEQRHLTLSGG